jgi:hypothetical protein
LSGKPPLEVYAVEGGSASGKNSLCVGGFVAMMDARSN